MTVVVSQNGWSCDPDMIASYDLPGGRVALRKGDASVVLLWFANQWHTRVESLEWPGIWGYASRNIRGSTTSVSNHASGTAIDLNAPEHPLGTAPSRSLSPAQIATIHRILAEADGVIRWGGDYTGRQDPMHGELNAAAAAVKAVADRIRSSQSSGPAPLPSLVSPEDDVMYIKYAHKPDDIWYALLAGPMFVGLGSKGEREAVDAAIAKGATVQWVEAYTWAELDRRSHAVCDSPRLVTVTTPTAPVAPPAAA